MSSSEIKPSSYELMSSISNQLTGYGGIPSGCGSNINGRKLPEGTGSNGVGASSTSPSGNSSSSFNSHSNMNSNTHNNINSSSPSSYPHSSYYAASAAATPAELAMYGHLNAFTSHHHRSSHHHSSSLQKPKAKARSNAGKTEYFNLNISPKYFLSFRKTTCVTLFHVNPSFRLFVKERIKTLYCIFAKKLFLK